MEQDGHIVQDNFAHEQILIIEEKGNTILFTAVLTTVLSIFLNIFII